MPGGLPAARERLLRYCARPPLALERLSVLDDGRICYRIKDTDQVRLMTPVQFLARMAALVRWCPRRGIRWCAFTEFGHRTASGAATS